MFLRRCEDSLSETIEIFTPYMDLLKENVQEKIGFYTKETNFFEFCLRQGHFKLFTLFNLDSDLKEEEKEMMIAGAFMYIKNRSDASRAGGLSAHKDFRNILLMDWYPQILIDCPTEKFNTYMEQLNEIKDPLIAQELEVIKLNRDLNQKPTTSLGKKIKV